MTPIILSHTASALLGLSFFQNVLSSRGYTLFAPVAPLPVLDVAHGLKVTSAKHLIWPPSCP